MDEWKLKAACRGMSPEFFFPGRGEATVEARRTCAGCPVRADCLEAGMPEKFGMWGGASERERRKIRQRRRLAGAA